MTIMEFIQNEIRAKGQITVDRFLEIVLYDQQFGYYFNNAVIGKDGDYVTSPEISQVFGELLALLIIEQWRGSGEKTPVQLIECGPGRGTLMADMLRVFDRFPEFKQHLSINLLEISPILQAQQKHSIKHLETFWYTQIQDVPFNDDGFTFVLANEFFDALPIKQFSQDEENLVERVLKLGVHDKITFSPQSDNVVEVCSYYRTVVENINQRLRATAGAVLIIDYGDAVESRRGDTLQALNRHTYQSIFFEPGKTDISHQVNFKVLKELLDPELEIYPLMTQSQFLENLGIETRMQALLQKCQTSRQKMDLMSGCARLVAPNHMGEIFKVLYAVTRD